MELVYLWVEDYKNIKKQGFNFSPRFTCDYDGKELTIKENDDYIENFFGDNTNITAIVGKNGSGKSSVLEFIKDIEKKNNKFCLIFKIDNKKLIFHNISSLKYDINILEKLNIEELKSYFSIFSYSSEFNQKSITDEESIYQIITDLMKEDKNHIFEKFKHIFYPQKMIVSDKVDYKKKLEEELLHTFDEEEFTYAPDTEIEDLIKENKDNNLITFICNELEDNYRHEDSEDILIEEIIENDFGGLEELQKKIKSDENPFPSEDEAKDVIRDFILEEHSKYKKKDVWIKQDENISSEEIYQKLYNDIYTILNNIFSSSFRKKKFQINTFQLFLFNEIVKSSLIDSYLNIRIKDLFRNNYSEIETFIENNLLDISTMEFFLEINKKDFKSKKYNYKELQNYLEKFENFTNEEITNIFNKYSKFFFFDFIDNRYINERYFSNLSHGEKTFYSQLITIFHKIYNDKNKNHLLLFDEPDLSLHPEWQRKYMYELINVVQYLDKDIELHFLVTSHSPFLLSDIPKENIIFLDTYKKDDIEVRNEKQSFGNCKVVDGLKETFGANIHTLLSDSFFMDGGLMGEFAKNKINKIIRFLNGKNKFIDFPIEQIEKVINTIGEPFLKSKLLDMYNRKFIKEYKTREKEKIEKQIEELTSKLEDLDND